MIKFLTNKIIVLLWWFICYMQVDQFYMAVLFWCLVKSDAIVYATARNIYWTSNVTQGTRKPPPCLIGHPVCSLNIHNWDGNINAEKVTVCLTVIYANKTQMLREAAKKSPFLVVLSLRHFYTFKPYIC